MTAPTRKRDIRWFRSGWMRSESGAFRRQTMPVPGPTALRVCALRSRQALSR
ncbi:MAG: hypothetical protein FD124_2255 [Alphaproteobacteria bacterium]|nr:MAG: hypothetical protein FD160_3722 [Caulobacteraceae bacterium]TPW05218.1 MAG: hypothetical protein FD124_2255 [Alphaproteobacteria bacterium]